jgi:hypothetical protein
MADEAGAGVAAAVIGAMLAEPPKMLAGDGVLVVVEAAEPLVSDESKLPNGSFDAMGLLTASLGLLALGAVCVEAG